MPEYQQDPNTVNAIAKAYYNPDISAGFNNNYYKTVPGAGNVAAPNPFGKATNVSSSASSAIPTINTSTKSTTYPTAQYSNPTQVASRDQTFGTGTDQFMIKGPATTPFPFEQQKAENQQFNQDFTNFLASQETIPQIQARYQNRYGIPDLQEKYLRQGEQMDVLGNQLRAMPQSVAGQTANTMLTQGQRDRLVQAQTKPLLDAYNNLGQINEQTGKRLAMAEQNLNDAAKLEMAQQQKMTTPWLQKYETNAIMQAREYSGWTFSQQKELDKLMANQQAGLTWTNAEANRAQELAMQENAFQNSLKMLDKQNQLYLSSWGA